MSRIPYKGLSKLYKMEKPEWGTFADRLKWLIGSAVPTMTGSDLARRISERGEEISRASISEWVTGKSKPSMENLVRISQVFECDPIWLATNDGQPFYASVGLIPIHAWEHEDDLPKGDYAFIPRLEVRLSAGAGKDQIAFEFSKEQPQAFRADWIRKKKLKPAKLAVMTVSGDSMEDRMHDGDAVVVDTSQTEIVDGKVYALWYDGGERIKRLYRRPGAGIIIHSDNAAKYPQMTLQLGEAEHVRIIGRVVHVSGEGGL